MEMNLSYYPIHTAVLQVTKEREGERERQREGGREGRAHGCEAHRKKGGLCT